MVVLLLVLLLVVVSLPLRGSIVPATVFPSLGVGLWESIFPDILFKS